jgi:hypothetical protein
MMKALNNPASAVLMLLMAAGAASAQVKNIPGESITATAKIVAIEQSGRTLTIKNTDGTYEDLVIPASVTRFSELKVGDTIKVRYYDNVVVRLKKPGEAAVNVDEAGVTPSGGQRPGGVAATQRTITATVTAIDLKAPSITVKWPNDWTYTRKVKDTKALATLKVGDRLDITWTEAVALSVESAK